LFHHDFHDGDNGASSSDVVVSGDDDDDVDSGFVNKLDDGDEVSSRSSLDMDNTTNQGDFAFTVVLVVVFFNSVDGGVLVVVVVVVV